MLPVAVIVDRHPLPTDAAHHETLKQRRTFSRRASAAICSAGLGGLAKLLLSPLVQLPAEIARMGIRNRHLPVFLRHLANAFPSFLCPAGTVTAMHERPRIPRIMQHLQSTAVHERRPVQISSSRCQSEQLRASRETSSPSTIPARPSPTSETSL